MAFIALTFPMLIALAMMIKAQDGGPVLFVQRRVGKGGSRFRCYKFRTMLLDAPAKLEELLGNNPKSAEEWRLTGKLRLDPRVTRLGGLLRKLSIDELPQLFNVLKGDMSLVGPRPIPEYEIEHYGEHFEECFSVRPGLTGLWQVSGRSDCGFSDRVMLDCQYVRSRSLSNDITIIFKTIPVVLRGRGSY